MKVSHFSLFGLFAATIFALSSAQYNPRYNSRSSKRVIGGEVTAISKFPHHATIVTRDWGIWYYICGGSIINDQWIVTAAHCFFFEGEAIEAEYTKVGVGMDEIGNILVMQTKPRWSDDFKDVETLIAHPSHKGKQDGKMVDFRADIGLVKLKEKLTFCAKIKPIKMHKYCHDLGLKAETPIYFIGHGVTKKSGAFNFHSSEPKMIEGKIISNRECQEKGVPKFFEDSVLCARFPECEAPCLGDSGGGIIEELSPLNYLLIGVLAVGSCESDSNYATRVANYVNWIDATIDDTSNMCNNFFI